MQRLKQVLMNLLQNAVKFTYEGKILVEIDYYPDNLYLKGKVQDTGIGISKQD